MLKESESIVREQKEKSHQFFFSWAELQKLSLSPKPVMDAAIRRYELPQFMRVLKESLFCVLHELGDSSSLL
jgi:hypothetical protein